MIRKLQKPAPGTPISSSLICDIIDELESLRLIETPGVRLGRGPKGTSIFIDRQEPRKPSKETPGCFEIRLPSFREEESGGSSGSGEDGDVGGFDNCYFMIGGKFYECTAAKDFGYDNMEDAIVFIRVDLTDTTADPTVETAESFGELKSAALDDDYAIIPLYKFGAKGVVEIDFRKMPFEISGEFAS